MSVPEITPADIQEANAILEEMRGGPLMLCSPERSANIIAWHLAAKRELHARDMKTMTGALRESMGLPTEPPVPALNFHMEGCAEEDCPGRRGGKHRLGCGYHAVLDTPPVDARREAGIAALVQQINTAIQAALDTFRAPASRGEDVARALEAVAARVRQGDVRGFTFTWDGKTVVVRSNVPPLPADKTKE